MPHYDIRHAINVETKENGLIANGTLSEKVDANEDLSFGDNDLFKNTRDNNDERFHLIINGDDKDVGYVNLTGIRCGADNDCGATPSPDHDEVADESDFRLWSDLANWDTLFLPGDNSTVIIPAHWKMYYDIEVDDSPCLKSLEINGELIFLEGSDRILKTHNLWVRSGYL